jgi:hypothetical protein
MISHLFTDREPTSQTGVRLREHLARHLPVLIAVLFGETVVVTGFWFGTAPTEALLAGSIVACVTLLGCNRIKERGR